MARDFNGSSDYITTGDPATLQFGTGDFTLSLWFNADVVATGPTTQGTLVSKNFTGFEYFIYQSNLNAYVGGASNAVTGATTLSTGTWYHACLVRSGSSLVSYLNGSSDGTATNSANANNAGQSVLFGRRPAGTVHWYNGRLAEVATWDGVALAAGQIAALAKGVSPSAVLLPGHYWPLIGRTSPEIDLCGGLGGTLTGTTTADHPRVFRPRGNRMFPRSCGGAYSDAYSDAYSVGCFPEFDAAMFPVVHDIHPPPHPIKIVAY